ncbi:hypothetical protein U1872_14735 [Sphingomonas sp. RB3P16]|uniref:hypothetical protein n=1 Tax=Parasphingomonas frigoris TaxID=3096163 RepID=UPI002FC946EB
MIYRRVGAAFVAVSLMTGCATVTRGTKQKFEIVSQPPGADVSMTTGQSCVTPCKLKLKRKAGFTATISKAGFTPAQVVVESKMHGGGTAGLAGNMLAGGVIGIVVDAGNGSLNDLSPNPIIVTLVADGGAAPIAAAAPSEPPATVAPKP